MLDFSFDTETVATRPGCKAPPMACLTWQTPEMPRPDIVHGSDPAARRIFVEALENPRVELSGHFIAYDLAVCGAAWPDLVDPIFDAYLADRVTCTMLREKLFDIAAGHYRGFPDERGVWRKHSYDLGDVARRRAGIQLKKDGWRKRYGEVLHLPLDQWPVYAAEQQKIALAAVEAGVKDADLEAVAYGAPAEILIYPLEDARATLAVKLAQEEVRKRCDVDPFADEFRQARASWWLNLMSTWGLRTRAEGVEMLRIQTEAALAELEAELVLAGLVRPDGSCDTKKAKARMLAVCGWERTITKVEGTRKQTYAYKKLHDEARALRKTKSNDVSLDRDACKASEDDLLIDYGERGQLQAVASKDVPMLAAGTYYPVHTRIDLAGSGRITSSAPNVCNLRRLPGIREAFVPRDGWVFIQADYPGLELRTLAQACLDLFGRSELARMLNAGVDPHLVIAAKILGVAYDEAKKNKKRKDVDDARQIGKVFNFGAPGGLGSRPRKDGSDPTLVRFARKTYGVVLKVDQVQEFKKTWLETFPEMVEFHEYVGRITKGREGTILQLRSGRIRGGCSFTAACNSYFQGLGADATKHAGFFVSQACYKEKRSPLFGSRIANYVYDEFILETPERRQGNTWPEAQAAAFELSRILRERANEFIPDVPFAAPDPEPLLMRLWSKDAEALFDTAGNMVPWEPALASVISIGKAIAARPTQRVAA